MGKNLNEGQMQELKKTTEPKLNDCLEGIIDEIANDEKALTNRRLIEICRKIVPSFDAESNPHFYHEIAETAFNQLILRNTEKFKIEAKFQIEFVRNILKPVFSRMPTQTWRSHTQILLQQFSTPPAIAFLLANQLKIQKKEFVLEPSAGTGSLAAWAKMEGGEVIVNEIDERRRYLLEFLGLKPTNFDGEFIHDYLNPEITVDVVLMNPPFSANGGRTKNSSKYGFRHVESALARLRKGGRFGVILGEAGGFDTKTGREFWYQLSDRLEVKANLKLSGKEYYKYGSAT